MGDNVNHPKHYNNGAIECIDAMVSSKGVYRSLAFCNCSVFKYNWRQGLKDNEIQEINKEKWYLDYQERLLNKISNNPDALKVYNKINNLCNILDELCK